MQRLRGLAGIVVASVMLAGCAGNDRPTTDDEGVFTGLEGTAQATSTTGAIAGVVVDDAIVPLVGANVTLQATNQTVATDAEGRFAFEGLQSGVHFITATARRHATVQNSVDVVAGEVATTRLLLSRVSTVEPYRLTQQFHGFIDNYLGFANFAVEVIAPGTLGCECAWDLPVDPALRTVMVEAVGQVVFPNPGTPATVPGDAYWEVFSGGTQGSLRDSAYDEFPLVKRFANETFAEDGVAADTIGVRLTCGVWPCVRMEYDLFVTLWYHEEAPEEWSFIAGDP